MLISVFSVPGVEALAGVGISVYVFGLSTLLFSFLVVTTTNGVAAGIASSDSGAVARVIARGTWIVLAFGGLVVALVYFGSPTALAIMQAQPEVAAQVSKRIVAQLSFKPTRVPIFVGGICSAQKANI